MFLFYFIKHINDLAYNIDLQYVLSRAESICLQLRRTDNLPQEIKDLLYYTNETNGETNLPEEISSSEDNSGCVSEEIVTPMSNLDISNDINDAQRNTDEAVVELKENTQSVF